MQQITNAELAAQLRALADIYEQNPEIPAPYDMREGHTDFVFCHDRDVFAAAIKAFGAGEKKFTSDRVEFLPASFPNLIVSCERNKVCERVVIGTRHVAEKVIPERVIPAYTEEIVEWQCKPFLESEEAA